MADNDPNAMTLQNVRAQYPQYDSIPDLDLANRIRDKFAPSMDKAEFYKNFGLTQPGPVHRAVTPQSDPLSKLMGADARQGIGTGINDMLQGSAQTLLHSLPDSVVNAGNAVGSALQSIPGVGPYMPGPATAPQIDQQLALREQNIQGDRANRGDTGIDLPRMTGNMIGALPVAYAVPGGGSLLASAASGAGGGMLTAAMQPVTDTSKPYWNQKIPQLAVGAGLGGIAGPAAAAIGRAISPAVNPQVQYLMDRGVTPTPGQILGGGFARSEEKISSIPLLGDVIKNAQRRGIEQFNVAAANEALAPIGQTATSGAGRDLVNEVRQRISAVYDNSLNAPTTRFIADPQFLQQVNQLRAMATGLPEAQARRFEQILDDQLLTKIGARGPVRPNQTVDGQTFKGIDEMLGKQAAGYHSGDFDNRQLGDAIEQLQTLMRQGLQRSNPQIAQQLQDANAAWANYVRLRKAGGTTNEGGIFSPAQFQQAVKASDQSVGKGQFAGGNALGQNLADAGKDVLGSKYPDSGTSGRAFMGYLASLLAGSGAGTMGGAPLVGAGLGGAATLPYTALGGRAMASLLTQRPQLAPQIQAGLLGLVPALRTGSILGLTSP